MLSGTYAFKGSESDLLARGLINGGTLDSYKARLLLTCLRTGADLTVITDAFEVRR
ncbi:hypothetical protein [Streptosporangium sp. NPDC048865]|uniref:hypothetical protein n=1 Tax=Streptosporangium sp. NPDC048865 TaxID=3155766 RepID=UPI003416F852